MESGGTPGRIQVTRRTYELLKDEFELEPRGTIAVKGKGEMETWYLLGVRDKTPRPRDLAPATLSTAYILDAIASLDITLVGVGDGTPISVSPPARKGLV